MCGFGTSDGEGEDERVMRTIHIGQRSKEEERTEAHDVTVAFLEHLERGLDGEDVQIRHRRRIN